MATERKRKLDEPNEPESIPFNNQSFLIDQLPLHILIKVINCAPIAQWPILERVSRKFRDIMYEHIWHNLKKVRINEDFISSNTYQQTTDSQWEEMVLEKLLLRAPNVTDIGGFNPSLNLSEKEVELLARFEKLRRVEFEQIADGYLHRFLMESRSRAELKHLVANERTARPSRSNEYGHQEHLALLQLETLDLGKNSLPRFNANEIAHSTRFPRWISDGIDASHLKSFSAPMHFWNATDVLNILIRTTNLKRLSLSFNCSLSEHALTMIKQLFDGVANLNHLESLTLDNSTSKISGVFFGFPGCPATEMLAWIGRRGILKDLSLHGLFGSSALLECVAATFNNLRSLEVISCDCDTVCLEHISSAERSLVKCRLLFSCTSGPDWQDPFQPLVPPRIIPNLLACTATLKSLDLYYRDGVMTKSDLELIASFTELEELSLQHSNGFIDDSLLSAWATGFGSRLKYFKIWCFIIITDAGFLSFLRKTPRLEHLKMISANAPQGRSYDELRFEKNSEYELAITDDVLKEIPSLCPYLASLTLQNCGQQITTTGLQVLIDQCTRLKTVSIRSANGTYSGVFNGVKVEKYRKIIFTEEYDFKNVYTKN